MHNLVERWYSSTAYLTVQHVITSFSNLTPIAFLDVLAIALAVGLAALWWRACRRERGRRRTRAVGRALGVTIVGVVGAYVFFQLLWGLNYQRVRLADKLALDRPAPSPSAVVALGEEAVARLNALHDEAHALDWREPVWNNASLAGASARVQQMLGAGKTATRGRLKRSLFGFVFRWNSVDGMVNPFGLEVIANPDLLPFERPFVAAHEWAHLAGYADESEANFVGWLTCVRADVPSQYSGWLYLYWQVAGEIEPRNQQAISANLQAGPRADLDAITARIRRGEWEPLQRVSWAAYDQYLKANAVQAGVRSYGEVITLLLRAHFEDGWRPVLRNRSAITP